MPLVLFHFLLSHALRAVLPQVLQTVTKNYTDDALTK